MTKSSMSIKDFLFDTDGNIIAEVVVCECYWKFLSLNIDACKHATNLGHNIGITFVDYRPIYQRYRKRVISDGTATLMWDISNGYVFYISDKRYIVIGHADRPNQRYRELTPLMTCHAKHLGYHLC